MSKGLIGLGPGIKSFSRGTLLVFVHSVGETSAVRIDGTSSSKTKDCGLLPEAGVRSRSRLTSRPNRMTGKLWSFPDFSHSATPWKTYRIHSRAVSFTSPRKGIGRERRASRVTLNSPCAAGRWSPRPYPALPTGDERNADPPIHKPRRCLRLRLSSRRALDAHKNAGFSPEQECGHSLEK